MTAGHAAIARQLSDELATAVRPLGSLLGDDLADMLTRRISDRVGMLAAQLTEGGKIAAQTVIDLAPVLWPGDTQPDPEWWRTPLGLVMAASLGGMSPGAVSAIDAARMLGVSRDRVYQLVRAGKLDAHPDGGVVLASVYQRIAST